MDYYEISEANQPPHKKRSSGKLWNILTILVLVTILCVVSVFFLIFVDPYSNLNPFPPPTLFPSQVPPTATVTPRFTLIPSWTPTNVITQSPGSPQTTPVPAATETPAVNPAAMNPPATPQAGGYAFVVQEGSPLAIAWTTFHPDSGCEWTGVAGQATSLNGEAVKGLFVQLGGTLPGAEPVEKLVMTGLAEQYGPGGFEIIIDNSLVATDETLWIQVLDQQNLPISDQVYFNTYDDCEKNLNIIYFEQLQ